MGAKIRKNQEGRKRKRIIQGSQVNCSLGVRGIKEEELRS